ncbi:hypothetical protein [Phycicoccus sp.]|uniref:hypothetical protein n=1 Tax=Phycicoccus sp. TaxID=1902410 RepID=UPI002BCD754D|nr:hypothetical protein [Phycicoccus sp.]HMM96705.1 hypothetical protein [Phycicoccus sp.]
MSGEWARDAEDAVAMAFGRGRSATDQPELDRVVAEAFGSRASEPAAPSLEADLVAAGYSESGARYVMENLAMGWAPERAVAPTFDSQVQAGRVASLVTERGLEVLASHGHATVAPAAVEEAGGEAGASRVEEARSRLVEAHRAAWPKSSPRASEIYAEAAVKVRLESAARNGWSTDQIVEALDAQARGEAQRAREARQALAESKRRTIREAGR